MLATSGLWFRYQDEQVLKGLTLDFSPMRLPGWWARTAAENRRYL